jgi:hypothetical protein
VKVSRKVTDFIVLEEGNIGHKSAVVTGALLASSVLGLVLTAQVTEAQCWTNIHNNHFVNHNDAHFESHTSDFVPCP